MYPRGMLSLGDGFTAGVCGVVLGCLSSVHPSPRVLSLCPYGPLPVPAGLSVRGLEGASGGRWSTAYTRVYLLNRQHALSIGFPCVISLLCMSSVLSLI